MFHKLRIRLTLFNLMIIAALLLLIMLAAFVGSPTNDPSSVNQNMLQAALFDQLPEARISSYRNQQGEMARLQLDATGKIVVLSGELSLEEAQYEAILKQVLTAKGNSGTILQEDGRAYIFLRIYLEPSDGPVIVLQEVISTSQSLVNFLMRIGPVLLFALTLVFFASLSITQGALVPIRKAWQKQVDFTSDASHELRTPLCIIQTNLECATDTPDETVRENAQWFHNIRAEMTRITNLVDDLLTISRSDSRQKTLHKVDFKIDRMLESIVDLMRPYAEEKGVALQSNIQSGLTVKGDKELLNRLVIILLDNAIKYSLSPGTVNLNAEQTGSNIAIKVSDTGIGIDKEQQKKIFDRFYRVDSARSSEVEGSGLGLSLAKWIVEEHKGSITVESTVGQGTVFTVML